MNDRKSIRCAIYTRVSTDLGLDQPRGSVKIPRVWSLETPPLDNRGQRR